MPNKVYEIVTQRIITKIEEAIQNDDVLPWQKPWIFANAPQNYMTGKKYKGVNKLLLDSGEYATWTQICDLQKHNPDIKLKKGCKKEMVVYFNFSEYEKDKMDTNGNIITEIQKIPYLRYYHVYNICDVEGLESKITNASYEHNPIEMAQTIFDNYVSRENITVNYIRGDKASYNPVSDSITLPLLEQYPVLEQFYSVLFHEAAHSTGANKRLRRDLNNAWASEKHSKEELVAEMSSCLVLAHCGILNPLSEINNIAYMRSWLKSLQNNVSMVVNAASQAEKAADFILNINFNGCQ